MNFLKNIADKAKSVADSPVRSLGRGSDSDVNDGTSGPGSQEGFICPLCLASFPTPEALQVHFELCPYRDIANESPVLDKKFGSLDLTNHNGNGQDVSQRLSVSEEENMFYGNQVKALEESKQLLTSEVISLRQQLSRLESDHVPNGKVLDRANELAAENVGLKAAVDDLTSENVSMKERLETLERERLARDSKDDSAVLKQELVNVQRAMDETLVEKEKEYSQLKKTYDEIFYEKQTFIDSVSEKDKEILKLRDRLEGLKGDTNQQENSLSSEISQLKGDLEYSKAQGKEKDAMIKERDDKILNLSRTLQQKISLLEEKLETEKEMKIALEQTKSVTKSTSEEFDKLQKAFEVLQKDENKLQEKLKSQEENFEESEEKVTSLKKEKENLSEQLRISEESQRKFENELADKNSVIQNLSLKTEEKDGEISRLYSEREDLLAKIEAGEGINEAITQLKTENLHLQERINENSNEFKGKENQFCHRIEGLEQQISSLTAQSS